MSEHIVPISISPLFLAWYFSPLISLFFFKNYYFITRVGLYGNIYSLITANSLTFNLIKTIFTVNLFIIHYSFHSNTAMNYEYLVLPTEIRTKSLPALKNAGLNHWTYQEIPHFQSWTISFASVWARPL